MGKKSRMDEGNTGKEIKRKEQKPSASRHVKTPNKEYATGESPYSKPVSKGEKQVIDSYRDAAKKVMGDKTAAKRLEIKVNQKLTAIGSNARVKIEDGYEVVYPKDEGQIRLKTVSAPRITRGKPTAEDKMLKDIGRMEKSNDRKNKKK